MHHRISFLGCPIDAFTLPETLNEIERIINIRKPSLHCAVNAAKLIQFKKDKRLFDILQNADIITADGQAVVWASRLLNTPLPERVAGIDLMYGLVELAARKKYRVYFLGARDEVLKQTVEVLQERYSGLRVAGSHHGYFLINEEKDLVNRIRKSEPDILLVGMSSPQKECFTSTYLNDMQVPFCMGVGGSFDVAAGYKKRAPSWMQRAGMEWFYRFLQEPKRMWKRYLITNALFTVLVLREFFKNRFASLL